MGRVLAIDYGQKRVGLAVTDPLQIIANSLDTVHVKDIWDYLSNYLRAEKVEKILVGYPMQMNNQPSQAVKFVNPFVKKLVQTYPEIPVELVDERFTSKMAQQTVIDAGLKKKDRQNKELIDKISATIILQSYLQRKNLK
ncbi:MAG: Holliday junction DNA helicase RuvA [Bacteroidetes bacterium GWC2_33_15]|nr:MAG: Holliday junction DNA helicase RuvA [Bacteroidetes bacterium GWA2_33_15]OFX50349.1 MAG: Holliday junction DNA helicase RuvA [Bacteroidetes bacterium GWC2_33_15]OFX66734.1 MAG: Holliday junction DNA helicase RuvA [Bacteroidetes bacterium GWB2_32_14]OFX69352.1 MAG: Holliday junction DNA helicase RuvA [Bacteroidetes bacterium GWD2_33_33]HAN18672.1 Holliday junction resolvase RuvX [Bacteroidales bacterium]